MDKALALTSLVVLSVVSGVTFAGHQHTSVSKEARALEYTFPGDKIFSQIVKKYEEKKGQDQKNIEKSHSFLKKKEERGQNRASGRTPHYLTGYRIRM